jgi:outer membrane receptor protein involved in Fe transport
MPAYLVSLRRSGCMTALALTLLHGAAARAQTSVPATVDPKAASSSDEPAEILVTGSRIERAGFNAPTPTTVIGDIELREGNRTSIAQVLNDQPAFRATSTPASTVGNTNSGASTADLRGLGAIRTLTMLNGHRFIGSLDLNDIPQNLIKRVEVVTGGASAAWGSGAVAGVVNIILDDKLQGINIGAQNGISSRGDAFRYGADATYGTNFAGGRGHFMISGEYIQENGARDRDDGSRPNLDSSLFTTASGQLLLANNVNYLNATPGGVITSGALAGQAFNPDGTLSPVIAGSQSNAANTIGGNSHSQYDYLAVTSPYKRFNIFGRASFEVSDALKISVDGNWSRIWSDFPFFPDSQRATATTGGFAIAKDNPFLSPAVRAALASGPATFRLGRLLTDIDPKDGFLGYRYQRDTLEGALSLDGSLGGSWKYNVYYDHGELRNRNALTHQRITANFANAIDAVTNSAGQIVCRVALTDPGTACRPLNIFGTGNASAAALAYAFGDASSINKQKLDAAGASIRGDLFSTWAGPVSIAFGGDWRKESYSTYNIDPLSKTSAFATLNFAALAGSFNVKEAFGEVVVPILNIPDVAVLDLNGAARYSDYSNSGGIWSWKGGGTLRLVHDLLLRGVYSRDIRSPSITELFTTRTTNIQAVSDPFRNNETVSVFRYGGGNPALTPETSNTLTLGGSYSPHFIPGLSMSLDYYKIDIKNVIATIAAQDAVNQCFKGSAAACATIVRDSTGQITTLFATYQNIASYKTRGLDMEASYILPLASLKSTMNGSLRFRVLATYVDKLIINDGVNIYDRAGTVGDSVGFSTPHWKGTGGLTYQGDRLAVDLRVRYVGGGLYNAQQVIINNKVDSRTYVDLGLQYKVGPFTIFGNINNMFDRDPPFVQYTTAIYDVIGRYFSGGVRVKF